jgi:hypothetical protein
MPELVRGVRVVQHRDWSITIEAIPSKESSRDAIDSIVARFAASIGNEVSVNLKYIDEIVHDRGKLRFVVRVR